MRLLIHVTALVLGGLAASGAATMFSGVAGWAVLFAVVAMSAAGAIVYASVVTAADHLALGRRRTTQ